MIKIKKFTNSIILTWNRLFDSIDFDGYRIYVNGIQYADISKDSTYFEITNLDPLSTYTIEIMPIFNGMEGFREKKTILTLAPNSGNEFIITEDMEIC